MSGPPQASTSDRGRFYRWDGEEFVSVTTVLKVLSKPALTAWAAKITAEAAVDMADSLAMLVRKDREGALKMLKSRHRQRTSGAGDLGSVVHAAAEAIAKGTPLPQLPDQALPYVEGFLLFWETIKPEPLWLETSVYSRECGYAGTADLFARIGGRVAVVDYKTSRAIYPEVALQLSAYANAEFIGRNDKDEYVETPVPAVEVGYAVHLAPHTFSLVPVAIDVFDSFKAALRLWRWQQSSDGLIGEPLKGVPGLSLVEETR